MSSALWVSKTGLAAQDKAMSTIANNLANVNTTGFKKVKAEFQDAVGLSPFAQGHDQDMGRTPLRQPGPLRDFWKPRSLQLHYFSDNRAGFNFFERLTEIQSDPGRHPALPVYALCLQFGLRGKYEHDEHGGERELRARRQAVSSVAAGLVQAGRPPLLLHAPRTGDPRRPLPETRSFMWIGISLTLFTIGFYLLARYELADMTATLQERLQTLATAAAGTTPA